jgi:hypothetical protein
MSRPKPERGLYRAITVVLLDGPQFQELPPEARWVFVCLKISLGPCGIQVEYPAGLVEKLAGRTGYSLAVVAEMLDLLQAKGWVRAERNVVWVVGQLQHEPSLSPKNDNHKPGILAHVKGLPRLGIVGDFIRYCSDYFAEPDEEVKAYPKSEVGVSFLNAIPHPIPHAMGDHRQGKAIPKSDTEEVATTSAGAATSHTEKPHHQGSCMALVVERLYFGVRPPDPVMRKNGSVLRNYARTHGFDRMAGIIEGLALRRDRGELPGVGTREAVSLLWLNAKGMDLNQLAVSEDAYFRGDASPRTGRGGTTSLAGIIGNIGKTA